MKEKILIVDDNEQFRKLLEIFLSRKYEVKSAGDGADALLFLQNGYAPDLIVSDYIMPIVDGKTLLLEIKGSYIFKNIPIIIMSSIDKRDTKIDFINSGASDYLVKPFALVELGLRIENLLKVVTL